MFRFGFATGVVATLTGCYFAMRALMFIGGENIAEMGAKIHAFERRYQIEAQPVLGDYSREQLSEPTPAEFRQMQKDRAAQKKIRPKA